MLRPEMVEFVGCVRARRSNEDVQRVEDVCDRAQQGDARIFQSVLAVFGDLPGDLDREQVARDSLQ